MKNSDITSSSIDELLQRVGAQPEGNIWLTTIVSTPDFDKAIDELREMLKIFIECDIGVISAKSGVLTLINQISHAPQRYLLLRDFESWLREDWQKFDSLRSRLNQEKRGGILILSLEATKAMIRYAPNFASWIGSRIFRLILGVELLTTEERNERLSALREWSGRSDSEVIELAEARQLPPDPEYGEWLVLLDRGDLLER
jgi:hypothetical protein